MPTILITGANRGIGLEFARQYRRDGWSVIATAREPANADELNALEVSVEPLDMRDFDAVTAFGDRLEGKLDLLIANAGTWIPEGSETAEDGRLWMEMMAANCIGPCLLAKSLARRFEAAGKLVAVSSGMGSITEASSPGFVPYRTSKAALNMGWHALAIELKPAGLITAVLDPGWVRTRMGGPDAPLAPEESVAAMRELIGRLGPADSGGFFRRTGEVVPW